MFFNNKKADDTPKISTQNLLDKGRTSIADIISPSYIEVDFNHIKVDDMYYRTFYVIGYPRSIQPNWLYPLVSFPHPLYISMFIYPTEAGDTLKQLKQKIAEMEATIESDIKSGKVVDPNVQVALNDALTLQAELAQGSERFFQFGFYITIPASSLDELNSISKEIDLLLSSLSIIAKKTFLETEEGFKSTIPMFKDDILRWRNMDTSSISYSFPFITSSLTMNRGILYGLNSNDGSLVIFDRFSLESANSVVLGKSGSGKSYFVKLEIIRTFLTNTHIIVIDPDNEYEDVCNQLGGEYLSFSLSSNHKINPFELNKNGGPDELSNKILDLHQLFKIIVGDITPNQDSILDKSLIQVYKQKGISSDPKTYTQEPPLLDDLYKTLLNFETPEAIDLSNKLEKFIKGSAVGIFNQQSNFDINNPCTVFGIRDIEENLRPIIMYTILNFVWDRIRLTKQKRLLVVDEAWYLIQHKESAQYLHSFAKRARKYELGFTTITQDVEDFLSVEEGKSILTNSSMQILFKQSTAAIDMVADIFNLTSGEKHFLLSTGIGEGMFFAGPSRVPLKVVFSKEEELMIQKKLSSSPVYEVA